MTHIIEIYKSLFILPVKAILLTPIFEEKVKISFQFGQVLCSISSIGGLFFPVLSNWLVSIIVFSLSPNIRPGNFDNKLVLYAIIVK